MIARSPDPAHPGNRNLDRVTVAYPALAITARFPTDEASTGAERRRRPGRRATAPRAGGIGVGSTRAALRSAFPATTCAGTVCRLVTGAGLTRFHLAGGRVVRVAVSRPLSRNRPPEGST